jgi:hypothetical protein
MASTLKVMIIRHGEKPTHKHQAPFGVTADGEEDFESLVVQGWQRAGALSGLFVPPAGNFANPALATPAQIYASKPSDKSDPEDVTGSRSQRPLQTIAPLAAKLALTPETSFGKGDEAALVAHVLAKSGVVLISWQHEAICDIAQRIVATSPPKQPIPSKWPGDRFDVVWIFDAPASSGERWGFTQVPEMLLAGDSDKPIS